MVSSVELYGAVGTVFLILEALWIGLVAKRFYGERLGQLMADRPNFVVAGLFYALYILGIVIFVAHPALESGSWGHVAIRGALFGLFAYATYDLSNLATLRGWPAGVALADLTWGMTVTAVSAAAGVAITRILLGS